MASSSPFRPVAAVAALFCTCLIAHPVSAQVFEAVGARALGMGGAFVAVADDATATYWNPAGLATGGIFSGCLALASGESLPPAGTGPEAKAAGQSGVGFCLALPSIGLSYNRLRVTEVGVQSGSTGQGVAGRQDLRTQGVGVSSLVTHQLGVTFVQSLTTNLALGATLKYIRGIAAAGTAGTNQAAGEALDAASGLSGRGTNSVDADVGFMATAGAVRAGLVVRNLRQPEFAAPSGQVLSLARQVRAGLAWAPSGDITANVSDERSLILALDVDLTRTPTVEGDRRMVAVGAERWFLKRRLGVRAGARLNTVGGRRAPATGGASYAIRSGVFVEGHAAAGGSGADRGWGVGVRVGF